MGASVIFGISPSDNEFPDHKGAVKEYTIDDTHSRFGDWNDASMPPALENEEYSEENCHTIMKFTTSSISGESLNMTGSNRLIWALRASTYMHIGKDSYHEFCTSNDDEGRKRGRGGGAKHPWIVDFENTTWVERMTMTPTTTTTPTTTLPDMTDPNRGHLKGVHAAILITLVSVGSMW